MLNFFFSLKLKFGDQSCFPLYTEWFYGTANFRLFKWILWLFLFKFVQKTTAHQIGERLMAANKSKKLWPVTINKNPPLHFFNPNLLHCFVNHLNLQVWIFLLDGAWSQHHFSDNFSTNFIIFMPQIENYLTFCKIPINLDSQRYFQWFFFVSSMQKHKN